MKANIFKLLFTLTFLTLSSITYANVELEIVEGTSNPTLKASIEKNASRFLTEVTDAYNTNRALNLNGLVKPSGEMSIEMLWENVHFKPEDSYIGETLLSSSDGYQIRNIALELQPQDDNSEAEYKEAVINFDKSGNVTDVYFSIDNNTYKQLMEKGKQLDDMEKRLEILDYVERFRTSYNTKDLNFLNQVFSDDALIITGKVVTPKKVKDGMGISLPSVTYTKQGKKEYLSNLARVFQNNRYINVNFDDVTIKRHGANPDIYGVRVVQHYQSSNYSDEGYVFMVWDFSDPEQPQIHVRTWQPMYLDKNKQHPLPESEIFDINSIGGI
ncbi:MAG: hypothetical protein HDR88_02680 [Bacteroides sp.]|nr:hypothetical protein [Bacteroides sp.]